jgi:uncharacterized FAD-dependent dehydrogenase
MHESPQNIAIVGSGLAAITCARTLVQAGHSVTLFEKSRGVGGRMSTRNSPFGTFDHGAQYFTVRDPRFVQALETTPKVCRPWSANMVQVLDERGRVAAAGLPAREPHWVAKPAMNALAKAWAAPLAESTLFETRVTDFIIKNNEIQGVVTQNGNTIAANKLILATGHSARDIFELLDRKKILIEAKPFAMGVRAEHPQELIDKIQYSCDFRGDYLPPAPYSIVKQVNGRGMYSFCMCPGGVIAPCATNPGEVVTNGWSPSKRDQATANSGIVVELKLEDFKPFAKFGALAGMEFQKSIEQKAWHLAGQTQKVPAQRMIDFTQNKVSASIPKTSYVPGTTSVEMGQVFPDFLTQIMREGFKEFGKAMRGYMTNEAILHAPESRTSSPVRIPRDNETLEHPQIKGLYPCGEGAGFAGGIISAAIDGEKCALKIAEVLK